MIAEGISAAFASEFLPLARHETTPSMAGNAIPMAKMKDVRFRIILNTPCSSSKTDRQHLAWRSST
jgi:hypothetical protein